MNKEEIKELQKLLEEHFELKELKDWDWRLEQIENWVDSKLHAQKEEIIKMIDKRIKILANVFDIQDVNKIQLPPNIKIAIRELEDIKKLL